VSVGKDITGESSATVLFGFINIGGDTKFADGVAYSGGMGGGAAQAIPLLGGVDPVGPTKAAAAYKAVTAANADIIIAPRYEVDVQDYFIVKMVNVNVKGKAGTIKNIRNK
jgi:hypothetical protein